MRGSSGSRVPRFKRWLMWFALLLAVLAIALLAVGCANVAYLAQSAHGHMALVAAARPVDDWLANPALDASTRERLQLAQQLRAFASNELLLPRNASYTRYADLRRTAAVWNVTAAPALSLTLKTHCFPIVGCVGYRGYFDEASARAEGDALKAQGLDVNVYPVPAYSTLGYGQWLGGDPLLSTFIHWPPAELGQLIFHELAHQQVYATGDTAFNESFATAVQKIGLKRWAASGDAAAQAAVQAQASADARRLQFEALTATARNGLAALYASSLSDEAKRAGKAAILADLRAEHAALKAGAWQGYTGYDRFIANANNASLAIQGAYLKWVPAFEALYAQEGQDLARFYAAVQALANQPAPEREAALNRLAPLSPSP